MTSNDTTPDEDRNNLARREFRMAAGVAAASVGIAGLARGQQTSPCDDARPISRTGAVPRRKLGAQEVSALGLGCMSMNGGQYNPPRDRQAMIRLIHQAVDRTVDFFRHHGGVRPVHQ